MFYRTIKLILTQQNVTNDVITIATIENYKIAYRALWAQAEHRWSPKNKIMITDYRL